MAGSFSPIPIPASPAVAATPTPPSDGPRWTKWLAPAVAVFVGCGTLIGFGSSLLDSRFETKAHAQETTASQAAALAAAKAECELRLEQSLGKVRMEIVQIQGTLVRLDGQIQRQDATLQRIADHLRVPAPLPGFVPLYAPAPSRPPPPPGP